MKAVSIVLICVVALSIIFGCIAINVCHADNPHPYSPDPSPIVEPLDNPHPYNQDPIEPLDNPHPY